jgi:hypothetical protein
MIDLEALSAPKRRKANLAEALFIGAVSISAIHRAIAAVPNSAKRTADQTRLQATVCFTKRDCYEGQDRRHHGWHLRNW